MMMQPTLCVMGISLLLFPVMNKQHSAPVSLPEKTFHLKVPVASIPAAPQFTNMVTGEARPEAINQGSWYTAALKEIEEREYHFTPLQDGEEWVTPNRKQHLRFRYTPEGFSVTPRTSLAAAGNKDPLPAAGKSYRYLPDWNIQFELDKKNMAGGYWQVNGSSAEYITPAVTVQYINSAEGMRQNFIVQKPLQPTGDLEIAFAITTDLKIKVHKDRLQFFHKKENVLNYQDLKVWDACGKLLEASFKKNKKGKYAILVNDKEAVYPITIDPISTTPSAIVESNQTGAAMGISVTGAGDVNRDGYSDVAVGAYLYDNGQTDEGAVFIYHGSAAGISTIASAMMEGNQVNAQLGWSVATAGDVNGDGYSDLVAGAPNYNNGQANEGAVFIYHGSATGINTTAAAFIESNQANAFLGGDVSGAGDVNGDGYSDIIAGAHGYDNGETDEGAAFIYHGAAAGINTTAAARVESNQASAELGISVAGAGDVNGDGFSDIITCSDYYSNGQVNEGAAFVYHGSAAGINTIAVTQIESNQVDAFMSAVAGAGDVNGDGYSDVVTGIYSFTNGQTNEGVAFIYHGSPAGITNTVAATLESNQASAQFAASVACAGDVNGDGYSDVIAGAPYFDNGETNEGATFIYLGSASGVTTGSTILLESNQANALQGTSVASAGDVNGDGYSDIITGAQLYDNGETNEGAAFVYHGSAGGTALTVNSILQSNQAIAQMGISVASAGDVNGDGYSDVIAGAVGYDNGQANEGAAFIYHGSATGISATANAMVEGNQANSWMGFSVAGAGDVNGDGYSDIIVGAPLYNGEGAILIYHGSASGINLVPAIIGSNQAGANLGISVESAGDVNGDGFGDVIAGAPSYSNGENGEGATFIYYGSNSGTVSSPNTRLEANQVNAGFGISVGGAGDVNGDGFSDVIIGARLYDNGQPEEGAVFVYHGSSAGISTTAATFLECNQPGAEMGCSVAAAGDINGDGYGDVIAGAYMYDNGQTNEGVAFVYQGSGSGINNVAAAMIESNQANAVLGASVAGAGDLNGDGYGDVMAGAVNYTNGQVSEGGVFIYNGTPAGISTLPTILESNLFSAQLGSSVACAGDVNGDGYSDLIIGARGYSNPEATEGASFIYHGNSPGNGKRNNLRLYNADLVTPMQQSNLSDPNLFGIGLYTKSPEGRQKGKLVWETVANGNPFSGNPVTNSVSFTTQAPAFTDLGIAGTELKRQVAKQIPAKATYIRARVKYDPVTSLTGQVYGPWRYPAGFLQGKRDVGAVALPVKFLAFTVSKEAQQALLHWITADETPGVKYEVQHSTDGIHFTTLHTINSLNSSRSEYEWLHTNPAIGKNYYRIRATEQGEEVITATRLLTFGQQQLLSFYPNPVTSGGMLTIETKGLPANSSIQLLDIGGKLLHAYAISGTAQTTAIKLPAIPAGPYFLKIIGENNVPRDAGKIMVIR